MGEFYVIFINISLNSCNLENVCLISPNCEEECEVVEFYSEKQNSEPSSNVIGIGIQKGVVTDCSDEKISLLFDNGEKCDNRQPCSILPTYQRLIIGMDGYALSLFLFCLNSSQNYVKLVSKYLSSKWSTLCKRNNVRLRLSKLLIKLSQPDYHVMDLLWAKMACRTIHELRQLQYAMSWLSTLGGAFSALGEQQERCAKAAGAISVEQMRIAMKLGDKIVITQCKLYFSLSLIQRGYCKLAKKLILEQYSSLKNSTVVDRKTLNMCKGIWARLKYELQKRRKLKGSLTKEVSGKPKTQEI